MASYLTVAEFKLRTIMPQSDVDLLESQEPGFLDSQLASKSSRIDARLRKRYLAPFSSPVPDIVLDWLQRLVTPHAYLKRGVNPSDAQFSAVIEDAKAAETELKEAADSQNGLYDLPLRSDLTTTGISQGAPMAYSEASPYAWTTIQAGTGREEDSQ